LAKSRITLAILWITIASKARAVFICAASHLIVGDTPAGLGL
jgi:hypothetical protein